MDDVPGEAEFFQGADRVVGEIEFPPFVAVAGHALVGVVVVVPAFAPAEQADPPEVLAVVGGFVVAVAPDVRRRVDEPGDVVDPDHADEHAPDDERPGGVGIPAEVADGPKRAAEDEEPDEECFVEEADDRIFHQVGSKMFAHVVVPLAAEVGHEPEHVAPEAAVARGMRIAFLVAKGMMLAMVGNPDHGGAFAGEAAEERDQPFDGAIGLEAAVGEQAMIAETNADAAGEPVEAEEERDGFPSEEERSGQRAGVDDAEPNDRAPIEAAFPGVARLQRFVGTAIGSFRFGDGERRRDRARRRLQDRRRSYRR